VVDVYCCPLALATCVILQAARSLRWYAGGEKVPRPAKGGRHGAQTLASLFPDQSRSADASAREGRQTHAQPLAPRRAAADVLRPRRRARLLNGCSGVWFGRSCSRRPSAPAPLMPRLVMSRLVMSRLVMSRLDA